MSNTHTSFYKNGKMLVAIGQPFERHDGDAYCLYGDILGGRKGTKANILQSPRDTDPPLPAMLGTEQRKLLLSIAEDIKRDGDDNDDVPDLEAHFDV